MKFELTTWERMRVLGLVARLRNAPLATIRKGMRAMDALEMTDEEKATVGFRQASQGVTWTDGEHVFVVEIPDREAANLVLSLVEQEVKRLNERGWGMGDRFLIPLCDKLGIELEEGVE